MTKAEPLKKSLGYNVEYRLLNSEGDVDEAISNCFRYRTSKEKNIQPGPLEDIFSDKSTYAKKLKKVIGEAQKSN